MCVCDIKRVNGGGSGIIWRGRCWNILSSIIAMYTGEMDGRTTGRGAREEGEGGEEKQEQLRGGKRENQSNSPVSLQKPYLG